MYIHYIGIIWAELGKDTYEKWGQYLTQCKNANELMIACKMYSQLVESSFKVFTDSEQEHEKKQTKQQSQQIPQSKAAPNKKKAYFLSLYY